MKADKTKKIVRYGFGVVGLLMVLFGVFAIQQLRAFNSDISTIVNINNKKSFLVNTMQRAILQRSVAMRDLIDIEDPFDRDEALMKFYSLATAYVKAREDLLKLPMDAQEQRVHDMLSKVIQEAQPLNRKAAELIAMGEMGEETRTASKEAYHAQQNVIEALSELANLPKQYSEKTAIETERYYKQTLSMLVVIGSGAFLMAILIVRYIMGYIAQKNKELIEATKTKSMFLANMSHEIRTPLTAIIGFGKTLMDNTLPNERRIRSTKTIIRNGEHLLSIINDILDLSKIEANKLEVERINCSQFNVLNDLRVLMQEKINDKGLEFDIKYSFPQPGRIVSDPVRIKQILINLCSNACKFTKAGHIFISVNYDMTKNKLCFAVEDTGIGLTDEQKNKVFDSFSQAGSSTTRKFGGTGLGLTISRQLAEKLGGELSVESEHGKGSKFILNIDAGNVDKVDFVSSEPDFEKEYDKDHTKDTRKKVHGTVLLVEDIPDNQELICFYLEEMGATVELANNGVEALEKTENQAFDLILMDMQMPVMGGLEAVEKLRQRNYDKPIIMLTANAMEHERQQCFDAGCDDFLTKPIDEIQLYKLVSDNLTAGVKNNEDEEQKKNNSVEYMVSTLLVKNPDKYYKLVSKFVNKLPEFVEEIESCHQAKDEEALKASAHRLKGVGGNYGFPDLTEHCRLIEEATGDNNEAELKCHVCKLQDTATQIVEGQKLYEQQLKKQNSS